MSEPAKPISVESDASIQTLSGLLDCQARARPNSAAVIARDVTLSFQQLHVRAEQVRRALVAAGVRRGDRVGLLMPNSAEWLQIMFGAVAAGAVAVPFSTWSTSAELEFLVADAQIRILFAVPGFNNSDFAAQLSGMSETSRINPALPIVMVSGAAAARFLPFQDFLDRGGDAENSAGPRPDDDALLLYTSGSTSRPKGVRLVHRGIVQNGFNIGERQGLVPGDKVFLPAPLFWSYGSANALPATFTHGAALVLAEKFDASDALATIERVGCTAIYTMPAMTNAMVRSPGFDRSRTRTLRTGLTIGSPEDFRMAVGTLGAPQLCNIYGATETYGNCAVTWHHWPVEQRARCQGEPLPGQEFRFRHPDTGALVELGEPGLVEVKGFVSPGYSGASAAINPDVFTTDGFYRTGDIGRLDENGAFVFIGRDAEMIKRAGINVSPAEIEEVLVTHMSVAQAAVVGIADAERGERIVAYVVPEDNASLEPEELAAHCAEVLSKYKLPDRYEIIDALPLTATGKLQRKELKRVASEMLASRQGIRES